jgi:hypothetical protein
MNFSIHNHRGVSMRKTPLYISSLCLIGLIGCSGVPQAEINTKLASTATEPGKSRLLIYRDEDIAYMGVSARIDMNGQRITELWRGDAYVTNVAPGKINLSADAWSAPGHYTATLDAEPDFTYTLEVTPRAEAAYILGGVAGAVGDYAVNENSGAFSIMLKDTAKNP